MLMPNSKIAKPLRRAAFCLTLLTALLGGGILTAEDRTKAQEIAREIARCDGALRELGV